MKVKDLIKKLKDMPQDMDVYMHDHDQTDEETSGSVNCVYEIETESHGLAVVLSS